MNDDASVQPGKLGDCLLHETAVAWSRRLEWQTLPLAPHKTLAAGTLAVSAFLSGIFFLQAI